ncbi:biopolymer transporter ExbD [Fontimonas sp. SYSU GA230001]|uniref:ExbD/TolR family protein n=1 Tax=Fontimonas sp. SYSU GA230001 TaxID=3142450 RepID=UPI0032B3B9EF
MRLDRGAQRRVVPGLTALVDVVFILLFFFMLAARPPPPRALDLQMGPSVDPAAAAPAEAVVLRGGRLRWAGREWAAAELAAELHARRARSVPLAAEPAARLQDLLQAFDALRAAGLGVELAGAA